jgi:hypothetical protein
MTPHREPTPGEPPDDEPPPILGSWSRLYALVIVELIAVIALCGWLSRPR